MTDEEYVAFLKTLARKHLTRRLEENTIKELTDNPKHVSDLARLLRVIIYRPDDDVLFNRFIEDIYKEPSPIERTQYALDLSGILDALDDAGVVVFGEFRKAAIPEDDILFLRQASYNDEEVDILIAVAVFHAHTLASTWEPLSAKIEDASKEFQGGIVNPEKKRKLFSGLGKILGGAIAGAGNGLMATGTIIAPNPATAYGAIASGALAVSSVLAGIGELRGE